MILETYTTAEAGNINLPDFLDVDCEITDQPLYSMYNLSEKKFHDMEVTAGAPKTSDSSFDYRQIYAAEVESGHSGFGLDNGLQ